MSLTHADVKTLLEIVDSAEHLDEIELVFAGLKLHVRRSSGEAFARASTPRPPASTLSAPSAASPPSAAPSVGSALAANEVAVRAPMLGTFYRSPSPGEKPFVEVGQRVTAEDTIGVVEVMKLFNTIRAGVDGTIVRIEAENAAMVEFEQPLVIIARG